MGEFRPVVLALPFGGTGMGAPVFAIPELLDVVPVWGCSQDTGFLIFKTRKVPGKQGWEGWWGGEWPIIGPLSLAFGNCKMKEGACRLRGGGDEPDISLTDFSRLSAPVAPRMNSYCPRILAWVLLPLRHPWMDTRLRDVIVGSSWFVLLAVSETVSRLRHFAVNGHVACA